MPMEADKREAEEANGYKNKPVFDLEGCKTEEQIDGEEESESDCLLPPRAGGMTRKSDRTRRKVQWNDRIGNKLFEVLEYEPSEAGDSDDEDFESCICTVM